jgi:hypothetical protein
LRRADAIERAGGPGDRARNDEIDRRQHREPRPPPQRPRRPRARGERCLERETTSEFHACRDASNSRRLFVEAWLNMR